MNTGEYYLHLEAKKGFNDWTIPGLTNLLENNQDLSEKNRQIAQRKLDELTGTNHDD